MVQRISDDLEQTVAPSSFSNLSLEFEFFKNLADFRRKALDVSRQVLGEAVRITEAVFWNVKRLIL